LQFYKTNATFSRSALQKEKLGSRETASDFRLHPTSFCKPIPKAMRMAILDSSQFEKISEITPPMAMKIAGHPGRSDGGHGTSLAPDSWYLYENNHTNWDTGIHLKFENESEA
jgi:hypothetical protein